MDTTTQTPPPTAPVPSMRPALRWLLIGSLTLNFLVIGIATGAALSMRGDRPPHSVELTLGPFTRALDASDRRAIGMDLRRRDDFRPPSRRDRDASLNDLVTVLRADPFSQDRLRELVEAQQGWVLSAQTAAQEAVLARIAAMSPQERAAFADRLAEELRHWPRDADGD